MRKTIVIILTVTILIPTGCTQKAEKITAPDEEPGPPPDDGQTMVFDIEPDCCGDPIVANKSNADAYCIGLGYEYSISYEYQAGCRCGILNRGGNFLTKVTCWKP